MMLELKRLDRVSYLVMQHFIATAHLPEQPDSEHIFWEDGGVHQNLTFPVQPDYINGQHCWHQKVYVTKPGTDDK